MAGFTDKIKLHTGNFLLKQRLKKSNRQRKLVNINLAASLGVIYHVKNERQFKLLNTFVKELTTNRRKVLLVGYVDDISLPDYCVVAGPGYYFTNQDLNWLKIPKNDFILKFIEKEFDILLDLTMDDNFTTNYIISLSKARLKAGQQIKVKEPILDVMINMDNSPSINEFIDQLLHYLTLLKSRQNG